MTVQDLPLALSITFSKEDSLISLNLFDSPKPGRVIPLELKFKYCQSHAPCRVGSALIQSVCSSVDAVRPDPRNYTR